MCVGVVFSTLSSGIFRITTGSPLGAGPLGMPEGATPGCPVDAPGPVLGKVGGRGSGGGSREKQIEDWRC